MSYKGTRKKYRVLRLYCPIPILEKVFVSIIHMYLVSCMLTTLKSNLYELICTNTIYIYADNNKYTITYIYTEMIYV